MTYCLTEGKLAEKPARSPPLFIVLTKETWR